MNEEIKMGNRSKTLLFLLIFTGIYVMYSFFANSFRNGILSSLLFLVLLILYLVNLYTEENKRINNNE